MPINIRRPGVPPKKKETAFVTGLVEAAKQPGIVARRSLPKASKPSPGSMTPPEPSVTVAWAEEAARIAAMSDEEFEAYLSDEAVAGVSHNEPLYRRLRK